MNKPATIEHEVIPQRGASQGALVTTASGALTPMDMLNHAVTTGAGLDVVDKLMTLQERWEANLARKAFIEAFSAFKSEAIAVIRNKRVTDGPLKGKSYAELFSFVDAVTPKLSEHGLSASWNITKDEKDWIEVTCTIEHVLGHSKRVSMGGPPDAGGAKNAIQARASTVTYLERHTLKAACGIAEKGDDVDGRSIAAKAQVNDTEADKMRDSIAALVAEMKMPIENFLKWAKAESISDIPGADLPDIIANLQERKRKLSEKKGAAQ